MKKPNYIKSKIDQINTFMARSTFFQYAVAELKAYEKRQPPKRGLRKLDKFVKQIVLGFIAFVMFT